MANLLTDVTPVLAQAFPNGKPELSASDFDKALNFVKGRRAGTVKQPSPFSMDYAFWAHTMIVGWRLLVSEWETAGKKGPEPKFLLCPECDTMMLLDMSSGDVLTCPGKCHRAIRVNTFVDLFRPPPKLRSPINAYSGTTVPPVGANIAASKPGAASLNSTVPVYADPKDFKVEEKVRKTRKAIIGWRMWDLLEQSDRPFGLYSLSFARNEPWPAGVPMNGLCSGVGSVDHVCPSWHHRCGIHAVKEIEQLKRWGTPTTATRVLGTVELWGRVLEYEEGYRAEWGYPLKLYISPTYFEGPADSAERLWEKYLTEVVEDDTVFEQAKGGK